MNSTKRSQYTTRFASVGANAVAVLTVALFCAGLVHPSASIAAGPKPKTQIKFATLAPEGTTWMKIMRSLDDDLRASTENRLGFKFYPSGVQGDEKDVLRKIRNGQLHGGGFTGFGLGAVASEFRALEVPFMYRDTDEVDYVREQLNPLFVDVYDKKGYKFLGWADVGFIYLYSNSPIRNPNELRAAKMWTWSGDQLAAIFFDAFDVSPIPLALPDVLTSLQMGVVNGVYAPPLACIALQWFTRVKYMSDIRVSYGFGGMLVSKKILKNVSAGDIAILEELCKRYSEQLIKETRAENIEAIKAIQKEGVELLSVDEKTTSEFFTTGRGAWRDGVGKLYPADLLTRITKLVDDYRSNLEAKSP